ncbi:hypothetical protein HXX76_003932 [Chlamydomonas incerta]|uniref:FUZ/MON1/HPS1 first Longin domain-containing protein n=1 Tax=Chlamydomonas incerta TaxID=51695 RepID=A0A835TIM1_CHLIN|nr:hypothetical protein HXX76_003932 [Chlamydomonas incerta]|eukprot:KAG2441079.1 hypothetical protein HXX76_003932 [Chlamydomonas incerta]
MPQLFCVLEEGGRALLTRAQGDIQTPSFPTVGLLSSIATYTQNSGHELRVIASANVRIVYRRFDNYLLFVLITSNLLLQTELLQLHLQTLYDAILLLLGSTALVLDTSAKIDGLKKKLRAPGILACVDSLIADDTLVPCILLPVPQVLGLPLRDKAGLVTGLGRVVGSLAAAHAALVSEGHYLAATHGWWTLLSPREQMMVQQFAVQLAQLDQSGDGPSELMLYVARRQHEAPLRLKWLSLAEGIILVVLFDSSASSPPSLQTCEQDIRAMLQSSAHVLETPVWLSPPVPQFSTITFDLALVVEHSPPAATLLWGHSGSALQQGFNPLMSPTLRKQMGTSPSPMLSRMSYRPPSAHREEPLAAGGDGLQLFFRSAVDTLVSFVLQAWPQLPVALRAALHGASGVAAAGAGAGGGAGAGAQKASGPPLSPPAASPSPAGGTGKPPGTPISRLGGSMPPAVRHLSTSSPNSPVASFSRLQSLFRGGGGGGGGAGVNAAQADASAGNGANGGAAGGAAAQSGPEQPLELEEVPYEEIHSVIEGARLLALLDRSCSTAGPGAAGGGGAAASAPVVDGAVDVFMVFPRRVGRAAALEAASTLRSTFLMAYHDVD